MTERVFFLGAGFSKAIDNNYPLMNELTNEINIKIDKESLLTHYEEIAPAIKNNVESLLTYLSTNYPWKNDTTIYSNRSLYEEIVKLISQQFSYLAQQSIQKSLNNEIAENLGNYAYSHIDECNFITLNYDLLLEEILLNKFKKLNSELNFEDFYKYPMANISSRNHNGVFGFTTIDREAKKKINCPAILKLHGSANWFWAGVSPSDIIYYRTWNNNETSNIDMGLKPYIIPPVMDKNAFYNHIAIHALWQQAEKLLKEADEIYIIGFSFPQTDMSVKYLFQSALRKSSAKVFVVNTAKWGKLKENYNNVFGNNENNVTYSIDKTYTNNEKATENFIEKYLLKDL